METLRDAEDCEGDFFKFLKGAWSSIDSAPFQSCWAIEAMCLPYETKVLTEEGEKPIGHIVETDWKGRVLSFNHKTFQCEWKSVVARTKSASRQGVLIQVAGEAPLVLTVNHPVFVVGKGYVRADGIRTGDQLFRLQELRGGIQRHLLLPCVFPQVPKCSSADGELHKLSPLWKTVLSVSVTSTRRLLQLALLWRRKAAAIFRDVSRMRWAQKLGRSIMPLLFCGAATKRAAVSVPLLRKNGLPLAGAAGADQPRLRSVLQQTLHWSVRQRRKPRAICERPPRQQISAFLLASAPQDFEARKETVLSLPSKGDVGYPPHRSAGKQQLAMEFGCALSQVPRKAASSDWQKKEYGVSPAIVVSVERDIRLSGSVYNIEIEDNHNYFASGVLVHNCDHLEAVTLGHIPRLLINIPPRCTKSKSASVAWPAWIWARQERSFVSGPQVQFLSGSYNAALGLGLSNLTRRLILSPWHQARWGERYYLRLDQNSKSQFDNTKGGSRIVTSVKGGLLGKGGDVICIDDPHNTETEKKVETDAERRAAASFWQEVSGTRLNDPQQSVIVVVMQRLHKQDISGIILDAMEDGTEDWIHLCLPMEFDERRCCVTVVLPQYTSTEPWADPRREDAFDEGHDGQLMWPERFGLKEVERQKAKLGPWMASGRLQQDPVPKGGGIILRDWWQLWDNTEAKRYGLEWTATRKEFPRCDLIVGSIDTSFGEKDENSFNAMTVWGLWTDLNRNRRVMLMFAWAKRLKLNGKVLTARQDEAKIQFEARQKKEWGLVEWVADTCKRYRVQRLLIEDKSRGRDLSAELVRLYTRENWGIELIPVNVDKVARTHVAVPLFTDDMIFAPVTRWAEAVMVNCANFPKDEFDDLHDTVTQFLNWGRTNGLLVRADEMTAATEDEAKHHSKPPSVAEQYGV